MKILLLEDDQTTRTLLEKVLAGHHTIEVAEDGRSALALADQVDYDLLLLDMNIPDLDSISVCQQLRKQGCQVPILLLMANNETCDRILGLDAGADDYMVKPFQVPELLARIRALLRRGRTTTASGVTWGQLHLDGLTNEIRYGEQYLRLTPKEHGILELLLLNPQRIFSRSAMIDRLWELGEPPTESAISSHIKAIRQKLKAAGADQDLIETIYGFGYRLRSVLPSHQQALDVSSSDSPSFPDSSNVVELKDRKAGDREGEVSPEMAEAVMLELWDRFKESFTLQFDLLDQVVSALQQGRLTAELRQEAKQTVHKLVGSLGVYGFPHGSVLAKQIEDFLHPDIVLESAEIDQIAEWVRALRQEVSQSPKTAGSSRLPASQRSQAQVLPQVLPQVQSPILPQVLVVDDDEVLTTRLQAEATGRSLHIRHAPTPRAAQAMLDRSLPDVIVLDLTFPDSQEDGFTWLKALKQQHPQIPVLVFTGRDSLSDRIAAARLGAQAFLQKPVTVEQIFQTIQATLRRASAETLRLQSSLTRTVMVVDDDPLILHQVSLVLSPWGLRVTTLLEPDRFWEELTRTAPDLLILDIEMPGLSGIELCQVVRNDLRWGNLPILFLTAHQEAEMIVAAFAAGGDDYIRKPILEPELVARVLNRLERGQGCWQRKDVRERE
jgi:DNA-binding response OmpR family regulator